ncbi:hypothetical protein [Microbacterium sp. LWH3-1.2]|uniref:hypothetical protein n=1 Tax=Microbacterium sp. LWH3-1.2 TaxID=3135256 RepID=UPI0034436BE7
MKPPNQRKYERLLRWYPRWWRDLHGSFVLTTLLDVDDARGGAGPTPGEAWMLRLDGLRHHWRRPVSAHPSGKESAAARRRWARTTAVIGAASLLTVAAGGWVVVRAQEERLAGPGSGRTLDVLLQDASEYQRAILSDGVVSTTEYEQALLDWRDCVTTAGAQPSAIYAIRDNQRTFDYEITAPTDEARVGLEVTAESCLPEYFESVGAWWVEQDPQPLPHIPLTSG